VPGQLQYDLFEFKGFKAQVGCIHCSLRTTQVHFVGFQLLRTEYWLWATSANNIFAAGTEVSCPCSKIVGLFDFVVRGCFYHYSRGNLLLLKSISSVAVIHSEGLKFARTEKSA
jgi:hypothetical protein